MSGRFWLYTLLVAASAALCVLFFGQPARSARWRDPGRPNVLLILADDLGYGDLSCTGSPVIETPHLDRLAEQGVLATQFYANSPVCSPSRASLLTGRWPSRHGIQDVIYMRDRRGLPETERTLATLLRENGYQTALIGKWHLGKYPPSLPNQHGFQTFFGLLGGAHGYFTHTRLDYLDLWRNETQVEEEGYTTDLLTREATAFLRQASAQSDPFFLYLAYNAPHEPLEAPEAYLRRYADRVPDRRRQTYAAMVTCMDDSIGQVLRVLEEEDLRDHTLVFFLSDNGGLERSGASNWPWRGDKGDLYEGGIHVPLIARWPGRIPSNTRTDALGCGADLFTTILQATHTPLPRDRVIDGVDFMPALSGRTSQGRAELYWRYQKWRAIRAGDWKLVGAAGEPPALYDLPVDGGETINLASVYPQVVGDLLWKWETFYAMRWDDLPPRRIIASRGRKSWRKQREPHAGQAAPGAPGAARPRAPKHRPLPGLRRHHVRSSPDSIRPARGTARPAGVRPHRLPGGRNGALGGHRGIARSHPPLAPVGKGSPVRGGR